MKYESTRSAPGGQTVSSAEAIVRGQAEDGGLYVPCELPLFSLPEIQSMGALPYHKRAALVLARFLTDFSPQELEDMACAAYAQFPEAVAPLADVGGGGRLLELFRGPTCAFKDFALQMLPRLMTAALRKTGETREAVVLTATSGDTGKAALSGFADVEGTKVCVFYPHGAVSDIQRLQMTTQPGGNVRVFAVRGNFDDAQRQVKAIFGSGDIRAGLRERGFVLSSANSINWGRLAPQIAYYFSAYCDLALSHAISWGDQINIAVPTGNFGNILAAYLAGQCGLPVHKLICASNKNRVLADFFAGGSYDARREFYVTCSPSMDILVSSNLERLLYMLSRRDGAAVRGHMSSLANDSQYRVSGEMLGALQKSFWAGWCDERETLDAIAAVYRERGYVMDTHTAVGWKVWRDYVRQTGDARPAVIAATASPFKFPDSVLAALGQDVPNDPFEQLCALERAWKQPAPESLSALRGAAERFTGVIEPQEMASAVESWL